MQCIGKVLGQTPFNAVIAVDGFTRCSGARCPLVTIFQVLFRVFRCRMCLTSSPWDQQVWASGSN